MGPGEVRLGSGFGPIANPPHPHPTASAPSYEVRGNLYPSTHARARTHQVTCSRLSSGAWAELHKRGVISFKRTQNQTHTGCTDGFFLEADIYKIKCFYSGTLGRGIFLPLCGHRVVLSMYETASWPAGLLANSIQT